MSAITIMATALGHELRIRGLSLPLAESEEILRNVIDAAAVAAADYHASHPALKPPSGRALDGRHIAEGASAVVFSQREPFRTTAERIVKAEQAKCGRNGMGWPVGCITYIREGDCGQAGGALVDAIAHALEDAATVDSVSSPSSAPQPPTRTTDGGRNPSGEAPAVTPAQRAYAWLWRDISCVHRGFAGMARQILGTELTEAEQRAAIAWVQREYPIPDDEVSWP